MLDRLLARAIAYVLGLVAIGLLAEAYVGTLLTRSLIVAGWTILAWSIPWERLDRR